MSGQLETIKVMVERCPCEDRTVKVMVEPWPNERLREQSPKPPAIFRKTVTSPVESVVRKSEIDPVRESTFYPEDFPAFVAHRMRGLSVERVATFMGVSNKRAIRILRGLEPPGSAILKRFGLRRVYAVCDVAM